MKKLILFLLLLTSCSLNSNSTAIGMKTQIQKTMKILKYEKDYSFDEYGRILDTI